MVSLRRDELVLVTFLTLGVALIAVALSFAATIFISYELRLGDLGILLMEVIAVAVGIWMFVFSFKRLRTYMSE